MKQLEIAHLDKAFDQQVLFKDASFMFNQGKIYGLLGRNGSGKSTLFNMIVRNLLEFVNYFMSINRTRLEQAHSSVQATDFFEMAGLSQADANKLLRDYSEGMRNKLQIVVSLMLRPPVLLLDEPLTTVDVVAAHEMQQLIVAMKAESVVIFSTHIMQLAQAICDAVVLLHNQQLTELSGLDIHSQAFEDAVIARLSDEVRADG